MKKDMSTFLAFRTAVISVLKYRPPLTHARYISATTSVFANGASAPPKTRFNKNAFLASQETKAKGEQREKKPSGPLKDEEITFRTVQITHDGRLSSPTTVTHILSRIDRRGYYILLVSRQPPLVKIVNKADEYNRKRQEQEQVKLAKAKRAHKEVQLSWATGEADTAHKLEKAREDLAKGCRVDLVFAQKKGQSVPSLPEMRDKVQAVVDSLADVGREWKDRQIQRRMAAVFLQGTKQSDVPDVETEGTEVEITPEEKVPEKKSKKPSKKSAADETVKGKKYQVNPIPQEIWDLF